MNAELRKTFLKPIFSVFTFSEERDSWKRWKAGNSAHLQFCKNKTKNKQTNSSSKYTSPQGEKAPPGFNLWLQTQYI